MARSTLGLNVAPEKCRAWFDCGHGFPGPRRKQRSSARHVLLACKVNEHHGIPLSHKITYSIVGCSRQRQPGCHKREESINELLSNHWCT